MQDEASQLVAHVLGAAPGERVLDACAARRENIFGSDKPIDRIAYIFTDEVAAMHHLHELWLRELVGPENKLGASVEITPKKVTDVLVVRMAACGKAKVRFVDGDGKPMAGYSPWLQLVVTPGPTIHKATEDKVLAAEVVTLTGRYGSKVRDDLTTDDKGCVTFEGLIPGATYRLKKVNQEPINEIIKEFTAEAGKTAA